MGMGVYCVETNTVYPRPVPRRLSISGPRGSHNEAEYLAILCALTDLYIMEGASRTNTPMVSENRFATLHSDSQLIIRQITGKYEARQEKMQIMLEEVLHMTTLLANMGIDVKFKWNPRTENNQKVADWLSKVGNIYFKDHEPDESITHGVTRLDEAILPKSFETIRDRFNWGTEDSP